MFCASRLQSLQTQSFERKDEKLFGFELDSMVIMKVALTLFGHVWHKGDTNCIRPLYSHRGRWSCTDRSSKEDMAGWCWRRCEKFVCLSGCTGLVPVENESHEGSFLPRFTWKVSVKMVFVHVSVCVCVCSDLIPLARQERQHSTAQRCWNTPMYSHHPLPLCLLLNFWHGWDHRILWFHRVLQTVTMTM